MSDRTPEQEAHGLIAEHRFFQLVGTGRPRVRGFVRAEQASALLDVRGIDGFVYHYRRSNATNIRRIPIQIKCGMLRGASDRCHIPVIPVSVDMDPHFMVDRVRRLLDSYEACPTDYESYIHTMERNPPTLGEQRIIALIEKNRLQFDRQAAVPAHV